MVSADLTLFAHVVRRPEPEIQLAEAALLLAEIEYPGMSVERYVDALDDLGRAAGRRVQARPDSPAIERVVRFLYDEVGLRGNNDDYYDPRNSFLNDVLDRKMGIPITLAIVVTEVARRAGVEAQGVAFPGHFLVRSPAPKGLYVIDPFEGKLLTWDELKALHTRTTGTPREPDARLLEAATSKQILVRMLNNLRDIYATRSDEDRVRRVVERLHVLTPTDEVRKDLDAIGGDRVAPGGSRELN